MKDFYQKYQVYFPAAFFFGGFLFDLLTTDRIDHSFALIQQLIYILLIFILFYWEVVTPQKFLRENSWLNKMWQFHVEALHFLFGSLLSLYTIFYFKSSSNLYSWIFMFFLAGLLVINELPRFQKRGLLIRSLLLCLCVLSYLIYLVPVITGSIGWLSFLLSTALTVSVYILYVRFIVNKIQHEKPEVKSLYYGLLIPLVFVILYTLKILPPVPVSIKHIGIYHHIEKQNGQYVLSYERPWWAFWQSGAQTFVNREGDKIHCFVSIFSPTQFRDRMQLVWYKWHKDGWQKRDSVPIEIRGGRDQGFRGFAYKSNFEKGHWQVRVVTSDEREVGRIGLNVVLTDDNSVREWKQDLF